MKYFNIFVLFLLMASCISPKRDIASEDAALIYKEHQGIVHFESYVSTHGTEDSPISLEKEIAQINTKYQARAFNSSETRAIAIELIDTELPDGKDFAIDVNIKPNGTHSILVYRSSTKSAHSSFASQEILSFLNAINDQKIYPTPYSFFETMFNARNGHLESQRALIRLRQISMKGKTEFVDLIEKLNDDLEAIDAKIAAKRKEIKAQEKARKDIMSKLDRAADDGQLRTLLQKNDRAGVVDLLQKYLPREQMTPMEHMFWDQVLNKIKNPAPIKDRVLVYRGTYGDRLYPEIVNGSVMEYDQAVKEGRLAAMSTIITRNQGTWNRRLRSLQTMFDKKISQNPFNVESEMNASSRLTTMMKQHSIEAQGSPFLSFTTDFATGYRFGFSISGDAADKDGSRAMGAFLIDPEILLFNQMTSFKGEMEYLHSLISFPEEMVAFYDESINGRGSSDAVNTYIHDTFKKKIIAEYGENEAEEIIKSITERSAEFNNSSKAYLAPKTKTIVETKKVEKTPGLFKKMWNKMTGNNTPSYDTVKVTNTVIDEMPEMNNCLYIIKSFF
ncbi:hypothetical protein [Bacteriovorax sp. Seq25_V]|uniref:hypothetical protein n=1 Tax=Bacteriovorax sp. Seq25_V TaxID=1201288 RepID=UPI000389EBD8|nr:hypothetical protein [Bacteriovorax sp. Seq25_V]EQC44738.1 putative lipoprotein [Bacteriovorax sp. Seq25_V]